MRTYNNFNNHTLRIKEEYVNAEDKAKEMEQKLEDALKEKYVHSPIPCMQWPLTVSWLLCHAPANVNFACVQR
jgi:hypothetical protein